MPTRFISMVYKYHTGYHRLLLSCSSSLGPFPLRRFMHEALPTPRLACTLLVACILAVCAYNRSFFVWCFSRSPSSSIFCLLYAWNTLTCTEGKTFGGYSAREAPQQSYSNVVLWRIAHWPWIKHTYWRNNRYTLLRRWFLQSKEVDVVNCLCKWFVAL
jgi:hypothetical protein